MGSQRSTTMTITNAPPSAMRHALLARTEIALIDLRDEAVFAQDHPLFAAQLSLDRIEADAPARVPRLDTPILLYDDGEGLTDEGARRFSALGYTQIRVMEGGLSGWRDAGYELFRDVNSYSKAFGELVEHRRGTPSLTAPQVQALIDTGENIAILDARRFEEYEVMSIPTATSVPGAELVLRAPVRAPDAETLVVVNCVGRTRSIIGTQSLINAGLPNRVAALRNGTIGWTLAGQALDAGQQRAIEAIDPAIAEEARERARAVSYRAGVRHIDGEALAAIAAEPERTLYRFDVRTPAEYGAGHIPGFIGAPGGQLVQETDMFAPVRGARIVLADDIGARANMTASWLAQMGWEVLVLDGGFNGPLETGAQPPRARSANPYKRPYEGTDNAAEAMQAYLDWEYGLVDQLARDGTHGFFVI
jgi:rhodanese-related sulfurtransferase